MNLVFLNSMEKRVEEGRIITAQISICEEQGEWLLTWYDPAEGGPVQEVWYRGGSWDEMLNVLREKLPTKIMEGYHPIIDNLSDFATDSGWEKGKLSDILHFYSEVNSQEELFQALRVWRKDQSSKEGRSAFILATNRALRMLSAFVPHTKDELQLIPGFGPQKVASYGDEILKLTSGYSQPGSFPLDWVADVVEPSELEQWLRMQKEERLRIEFTRKGNQKLLLEGIAEGKGLSELRQLTGMSKRELMQTIEDLNKQGYDMDRLVDEELQKVSEEEQLAAWSAFESLGDRYLKPVLSQVYTAEELATKPMDSAYEWLRLLRIKFRRTKEVMNMKAS